MVIDQIFLPWFTTIGPYAKRNKREKGTFLTEQVTKIYRLTRHTCLGGDGFNSFANHVSDLINLTYHLAGLASVYMMRSEILGHLIKLYLVT